jgi:hypothetical protein
MSSSVWGEDMFIGEATLKSACYSRRLTMLLGDLQAVGCTVWLEGLCLRFDLPGRDVRQAERLDRLMSRYSDIVSWLSLGEQGLSPLGSPARRPGFLGFNLFRMRSSSSAHGGHD